MTNHTRRHGITRVEIAVITGVAMLCLAVGVSLLNTVRDAARIHICEDHLHNLTVAIKDYESVNSVLPPGWWNQQPGHANWNWYASALPFVESSPAYDTFRVGDHSLSQAADDPSAQVYLTQSHDSLLCPFDTEQSVNPERLIVTASGNRIAITASAH